MALSVEEQLSFIEQQYGTVYEAFYGAAYGIGSDRSYRSISYAIKAALAFQNRIELLYEDIRKLSDEKTKFYVQRCEKNVDWIRFLLRGSPRTFGACSHLDEEQYIEAIKKVQRVRSCMYQFSADILLIYALRIYPIEEKMALKSMLTDYGFLEVTKCLEEAEENLATRKPAHFKDCIDRCREALEKTAASILTSEKKKPSGYFATDMGTLSGLGMVNKEVKKLTEATYSYLSEVGAHGRGEKVTLGDAHYAMKETYMRIDILLKRYSKFLQKKK